MARSMKSRAALAAAAVLALLAVLAAPSAAQDFTVGTPTTPPAGAADASKFTSTEAVHTTTITMEEMKNARLQLAPQLTPEQAAALIEAARAPAPTDAPGVESGASYAPFRGGAVPLSVGTGGWSFSDTRVGRSARNLAAYARPAGKLYFQIGTAWYICSASLIGRSLLVTAAHCVCSFGQNTFYTNHIFIPDYDVDFPATNVQFTAASIVVATSYLQGTDTCTQSGVICSNDLALIWLNLNNGKQAFQSANNLYYNYVVNGFEATTAPVDGFASVTVPKYLAITQLGYPADWDAAGKMQLSTSPGFPLNVAVNSNTMKNIVRGSSMTGGSSGGPWMLNWGVSATASNGVTYGTLNVRNAIVGVTSWGYINKDIKIQGASAFAMNNEFPNAKYGIRGGGNIGAFVDYACEWGWGLQALGYCR
ncbi:hypothetical protein Rsub_03643 [Raphidocelis subcapitata]|uniref:Peptidase S1 domain-containing protein n=1 Tax=Raphidocelis subcapitata TaxID=307507 RepID=A0A2V0P0F0_9CHLO|nr:hypothetical protein Rsub_03643 [Raphidocelis subcapitata]|eukprot:GBF91323.1 hypothetical protein Rsub_03643 [Raphidocelis subcapitata]